MAKTFPINIRLAVSCKWVPLCCLWMCSAFMWDGDAPKVAFHVAFLLVANQPNSTKSRAGERERGRSYLSEAERKKLIRND